MLLVLLLEWKLELIAFGGCIPEAIHGWALVELSWS